MEKGRLEAFTDGVIAVIITIMVLELKPPHGSTFAALLDHWPIFVSYVLSFVYVGIYWNNHHHLLHAVEHVNGKVMWANLFFLFWLSLFPFTTSWLNESWLGEARPALEHLPPVPWVPAALYGFVLLMTSLSWIPLSRSLIACNGGREGTLAQALGGEWGNWKAIASPIIYLVAIVLAYFVPIVSCGLYAVVAAIWFIPDRKIENKVIENKVSSP